MMMIDNDDESSDFMLEPFQLLGVLWFAVLTIPNMQLRMDSSRLIIQIDDFDDFNIFSKYTPAKPDVAIAIITDTMPTMLLA